MGTWEFIFPEERFHMTERKIKTREQGAKTPSVLKGIRDNDGGLHFLIGNKLINLWISGEDLINDEKRVFSCLANTGFLILVATSKNDLKRQIEEFDKFEPGLVATQPGWL